MQVNVIVEKYFCCNTFNLHFTLDTYYLEDCSEYVPKKVNKPHYYLAVNSN